MRKIVIGKRKIYSFLDLFRHSGIFVRVDDVLIKSKILDISYSKKEG